MTQDIHTPEQESLIEFPCDYELKAIGANTEQLETTVVEIVQRYAPDASHEQVRTNLSKTGKWKTVNITFRATCLEQIHGAYKDLKKHPEIKMCL